MLHMHNLPAGLDDMSHTCIKSRSLRFCDSSFVLQQYEHDKMKQLLKYRKDLNLQKKLHLVHTESSCHDYIHGIIVCEGVSNF